MSKYPHYIRYKDATHIESTDYIYFDDGSDELKRILRSKLNSFLNYYDHLGTSVTTITTTNFYKLGTTTTLGIYNDNFQHNNNRVTNLNTVRNCKIESSISVTSGNNNILNFAFFKNGAIVDSSEMDVTCSSSGKASTVTIQAIVELSPNDYIEVWVKNQSSNNVTLVHLNFIITEI
jgi:hypothetical protein